MPRAGLEAHTTTALERGATNLRTRS